MKSAIGIFDSLQKVWESKVAARNMSYFLTGVFVSTAILAFANQAGWFGTHFLLSKIVLTDAIEFSFNFLLFFEMIGLTFVIPQSIANSIGKQFQIMSLIFLRTSFEELSHLSLDSGFEEQAGTVARMGVDALAALLIFALIGRYYGLQKHRQIVEATEKIRFVNLKKLVAAGVLLGLFYSVWGDLKHYLDTGDFHPSYHRFYLMLIFADTVLMLSAFRYVIHFPDVFRYSAFVLVTIFIRIALMAPAYYNVLLGLAAVLFGIGVVYLHNGYLDGRLKYIEAHRS